MDPLSSDLDRSTRIPIAMRLVPPENIVRSIPLPREQAPGDVVVASVEAIGRNARVELVGGRLSHLHVGDLLVAVFANRYATQQFEAYARRDGEYGHLLSMGGLCGLVASRHEAVGEPTKLRFLGAVADSEGHPLKLGDYAAAAIPAISRPRVAVVCGSAMDSGKTFIAMSLIKGFVKRGRRAAYIKLTGTASGRDYWTMVDAGACCVLDFVDGGLPSTYLCPVADLLKLYKRLLGIVAANGADWVVIESPTGCSNRRLPPSCKALSSQEASMPGYWLAPTHLAPMAESACSGIGVSSQPRYPASSPKARCR